MALSKNEKEQLLDFIKSHYVDHHDVRLLIARDLEEDISQQMKEDEELSFEDALERAYKKYGVIGFSNITEDYKKKINSYFNNKVILYVLKNELASLKFWLIVGLYNLIFFSIIGWFGYKPFVISIIISIVMLLGFIFIFRKFHNKTKELKKRGFYYYLNELLVSNNLIFQFIYAPLLLIPSLHELIVDKTTSMILLAFFTMISVLAYYIIYFRFYKNRTKIFQDYKSNFLSSTSNSKYGEINTILK